MKAAIVVVVSYHNSLLPFSRGPNNEQVLLHAANNRCRALPSFRLLVVVATLLFLLLREEKQAPSFSHNWQQLFNVCAILLLFVLLLFLLESMQV